MRHFKSVFVSLMLAASAISSSAAFAGACDTESPGSGPYSWPGGVHDIHITNLNTYSQYEISVVGDSEAAAAAARDAAIVATLARAQAECALLGGTASICEYGNGTITDRGENSYVARVGSRYALGSSAGSNVLLKIACTANPTPITALIIETGTSTLTCTASTTTSPPTTTPLSGLTLFLDHPDIAMDNNQSDLLPDTRPRWSNKVLAR